jgi:Mg2+ and Co2+ transporter CorA
MTPKQLIALTNTVEKQEHIIVEFIRQYAMSRYEEGWDSIVEAWSDGDILEYLSDADNHLPTALANIQSWIDLRKEMQDNYRF